MGHLRPPPTENPYITDGKPSLHSFEMRSNEPTQFFKTAIPNEIAKIATISEGNHFCIVNQQMVAARTLTPILQHAPVRSEDQTIRKALIGSHKLSIKHGRFPGEGFHWDQMADFIRKKNYQLTPTDLHFLGCRYATDLEKSSGTPIQTTKNGPQIGRTSDVTKYTSLTKNKLFMHLDLFAMDLCTEIINLRANHSIQSQTTPVETSKIKTIIRSIFKQK